MFELKKFIVTKDFCGYRKGAVVAFNGKDAEKYGKYICEVGCAKKAEPAKAEVVEEVKAETPKKRRYVRKGRK